MNLQEDLFRIKNLMGLVVEASNPYKVEWIEPSQEYFKQELSELLGNPSRFTNEEFFAPENYDVVFRIMPHTFKKIAEFVKGEELESNDEIKNILLNQNITRTIVSDEGEWDNLKNILLSDPQCIQEGYDFFNLGNMVVWKGFDPENNSYVDNVANTDYMGHITNFLKPLKKTVSSKMSSHLKKIGDEEGTNDLHALANNIDQFRDFARKGQVRKLPPPFVVKYFTKKNGYEYVLIGGFKRSSIALELGIEPIKVWLIDLTK